MLPRPSPTPTAPEPGTLIGTVDGGCFGYFGPPNRWTVTVTASQHGLAKGSTVITEVKSNTTGGPYTMLDAPLRDRAWPRDSASAGSAGSRLGRRGASDSDVPVATREISRRGH